MIENDDYLSHIDIIGDNAISNLLTNQDWTG